MERKKEKGSPFTREVELGCIHGLSAGKCDLSTLLKKLLTADGLLSTSVDASLARLWGGGNENMIVEGCERVIFQRGQIMDC